MSAPGICARRPSTRARRIASSSRAWRRSTASCWCCWMSIAWSTRTPWTNQRLRHPSRRQGNRANLAQQERTMEMYYAKGLNLRVKMIGAALIMTVMLVVVGGLGLRSLSQVMDSIEATQAVVKDNSALGKTLQAHHEKTQKVYRQYQLITIGGILAAIIVPIAIAIYFVRTVSNLLNRLLGPMNPG